MALVTPTDRPKSVRNRCLIELFCGVVCVVTLPFWHSVGVGVFVIGLSQISSFFPISPSKLRGQGTLKSSLRKSYGRYGDLLKHYEVSLAQMLHGILGNDHLQWHPQLIRHITNLWTNYRTEPYYRFSPYYLIPGGFHWTLQQVRLATRGRLLLRTPGPVPFGTCICSNVETILSSTCHVYGPF